MLRLAALFSLDSFGGGFVVQSLLVLWLFRRFELSVETAGAVFFVAGLLSAFSQLALAAARRAHRPDPDDGLHAPARERVPDRSPRSCRPRRWPIAFLLLRMALSQMDVPARQSYVMAVVPPEERAAAASVTNVPRSLAAALPPPLAGACCSQTTLRLAADHRRRAEGRLRPAAARAVPEPQAGGRGGAGRCDCLGSLAQPVADAVQRLEERHSHR